MGLMSSSEDRPMTTATVDSVSERILHIEGSPNIRHIGGYATRDGRRTSTDLVRSASLHRLQPGGIAVLRDHGVRTVVDLRSKIERERDVTPSLEEHGIAHVFAPVFEQEASPVGLASEQFVGYGVVYQRMLTIGGDAYRALFQTIAQSEGGLLFHCAVGKDRTGVAAMLMLELAGVADEEIVADYAASAELLRPLLAAMLPRMAERGISAERGMAMMDSPREAIETTLAHLRAQYGSAAGYLHDLGFEGGEISAVKRRIVE